MDLGIIIPDETLVILASALMTVALIAALIASRRRTGLVLTPVTFFFMFAFVHALFGRSGTADSGASAPADRPEQRVRQLNRIILAAGVLDIALALALGSWFHHIGVAVSVVLAELFVTSATTLVFRRRSLDPWRDLREPEEAATCTWQVSAADAHHRPPVSWEIR